MKRISAYFRPESIGEAARASDRPGAVLIGGGTKLNSRVAPGPCRLSTCSSPVLTGLTVLTPRSCVSARRRRCSNSLTPTRSRRSCARRLGEKLPSTLRAQSTLGGAIVSADRESELLAALLVHDAVVSVARPQGTEETKLDDLLKRLPLGAQEVVTSVVIDTAGTASLVRTGRTPADKAIVAAAARVGEDGRRRLALSGVASTPVLVEESDQLDPPGDFRGSGEYRRALARVLVSRAIEGVS